MGCFRRTPTTMLVVGAGIWLFLTSGVLAQAHPGLVTISVGSGSSQADIEAAEALVARMLDDGELVLQGQHADSHLPGRNHEGFGQFQDGWSSTEEVSPDRRLGGQPCPSSVWSTRESTSIRTRVCP